MDSITRFSERVLAGFDKIITDQVFLMIQNDRILMHEYLKQVEKNGLTCVNQAIGKSVKTRYHLTNEVSRERKPKSTLVQSYRQFR